ncbi:MAG: aspartate dehydrogenase [Paracoccaceae bacterium]
MRLGVIGYGAVAQALIERLGTVPVTEAVILIRSGTLAAPSSSVRVRSVDSLSALLQTRPDLIVECAGHSAVVEHAEACLRAGTSLVALSLGAFADPLLLSRVQTAATDGRARLIRPSGAIAGIDLIEALSLEGPVHIAYTGTKPPRALRGTPAEQWLDLTSLASPSVYFEGSARDAALLFPRTTNVVAALALAGPGFENVSVTLAADPAATSNRHAYTLTAAGCKACFTIESTAAAGNPRSSLTTVYSILREVRAFAEQRGA